MGPPLTLPELSVSIHEITESKQRPRSKELSNCSQSVVTAGMLENCKELFVLVVFTMSGALHPVLLVWLAEEGAINPLSLAFVLPSYLGMTIAGVVLYRLKYDLGDDDLEIEGPSGREHRRDAGELAAEGCIVSLPWGLLTLLSICDIFSSFLHMTGLVFAGSSIYTLAYSSVTITTAFLSRIMLKRRLQALQWLGLSLICIGLGFSGVLKQFPNFHAFNQSFALPAGVGHSGSQADTYTLMTEEDRMSAGVALIVAGSLVHSFCFVLTEVLLTSRSVAVPRVPPHTMCISLGLSGLLVCGSWQAVFTWRRWDGLMIRPNLAFVSILLTANSIVHTLCFFRFIIDRGSTTVAVLKAVQASMLICFSHLVYCGAIHPASCLTLPRAGSVALSLTGALLYGFANTDGGDVLIESTEDLVVEMAISTSNHATGGMSIENSADTSLMNANTHNNYGSTYSISGDLCLMPTSASSSSFGSRLSA